MSASGPSIKTLLGFPRGRRYRSQWEEISRDLYLCLHELVEKRSLPHSAMDLIRAWEEIYPDVRPDWDRAVALVRSALLAQASLVSQDTDDREDV